MTSNLAAKDIRAYEKTFVKGWRRRLPDFCRASPARRSKKIRRMVDAAMDKAFDPEFINRFDEVLLFNRIEKQWLTGLVAIELEKCNARLARKGWHLLLDSELQILFERAYDPRFGARSIRRAFKQIIEAAVAQYLLGEDVAGSTYGTLYEQRKPQALRELRASINYEKAVTLREISLPSV